MLSCRKEGSYIGGFLGIGGSAQKTDRKLELGGFGDLSNVFNFALPQAKQQSSAGSAATGQAQGYFSSLLSGNRATTMAAQAPAINATLAQGDAAKRQLATSGTARGGGVAGTNQQATDKTNATIDNGLFSVRPEAAKAEATIGNQQTNNALQALGLAGNVAGDITSTAAGSRAQSAANNANVISGIASTIGSVLGGFGL